MVRAMHLETEQWAPYSHFFVAVLGWFCLGGRASLDQSFHEHVVRVGICRHCSRRLWILLIHILVYRCWVESKVIHVYAFS